MTFLIIFAAKYLYLVVIALGITVVLLSSKEIRKNYLMLTLGAFPLAYISSKILALFIIDPRPFIVLHIQPLIQASTDNGFPSDHTLLTMTIAAIIFTYNKKAGVLLACLSALVGVGRVLAYVHYPLDIIGSILIATVSTLIVWYAFYKWKLLV
ncbi:MAG: phosphatase PAP2 family protein [Patescibacteria group bacterium]|nr:phosphatase PAP2 family protein [Patescibacteria group bacterium]